METYLTIASKRDVRAYTDAALADALVRRILDAGRLSGSSQNKQRWEFVVVADARERLAEAVYAPDNVRTAALVVAIVGEAGMFDVGRCSQNMMLAAWDQGIASCPNGIRDPDAAAAICGGDVRMILSFGHPAKPRDPTSRDADEWSARANRRPLDELVRRA